MAIRARAALHAAPTHVGLCTRESPQRQELESFIQRCFALAYGAELQQYMTLLLGLRNDEGRLLGALGLREARLTGRLYLEHYLDRPAEQALARAAEEPVARTDLVEVGNLAVAAAGGGRWLIMALTAYLYAARRRWCVFTVGPSLRNAFARLGIQLLDLGAADPALLPPGHLQHWGCYYHQQPRVMAARVSHSHAVLSRMFEAELTLRALWHSAALAGTAA